MSKRQGSRRVLLVPWVIVFIVMSTTALPISAHATASRTQLGFKAGTVDAAAEQDFLNRTNALRASLGLGALRSNSELLAKARSWSQTQASSGTIFHSTLTSGVTQNWHRLGENVGMGPDVVSIHDALVRSPRHYENLADNGFTEVGIGVVKQGNIIYVTQVFMELMPSSASTPPATTSARAPQPGKSASVAATPQPSTPLAQAVPLKTASEDLSNIIKRLSYLES